MNLNQLNPRQALNKAFLKVKPNRASIENFKSNLAKLLKNINKDESEEHHKSFISDFLKKTYYEQKHFINTKERCDLVIHNAHQAKSSVGVIIEAKRPTNKIEMPSPDNLNKKAFHELIYYFLQERILHKNTEIKHLIITNINHWFIFDANVFEQLFIRNKKLVDSFKKFEAGQLTGKTTDFFYEEIASPFLDDLTETITFTYFDLSNYYNQPPKNDTKLIALFKLFSPEHLLKLPFANDSNSLDRSFYSELLHIVGLTETKDGNKKLIKRSKERERHSASIIEETLIQLRSLDKISQIQYPEKFGATLEEQSFSVALELSITWINRILFLKLLESQLLAYHKGDKNYAFLNLSMIKNFDDLNSLFFQVLAQPKKQRQPLVNQKFENVPYLNSSLFEPTELEHKTLFVSNLSDDKPLTIFSQTVLKDAKGKKLTGEFSTLDYLFKFLDAFDFSSEGVEDIQEDNKNLINASVLGLIFEKINGYKDGSFFTPGFITMYMCRENIRKTVIQKFNEIKDWECRNLKELYNRIEDKQEANNIINSLKICDPAVGSGHFLVSALNEIIAVKNDLKILQDREGKRLKEYQVEVVSDELVITDEDGELFEYNPKNKESQRVQETLFHEKQTLIENCLFGVDINPNSVKICRLRLWIELLKHAYYKPNAELETLPNIDINIKCGNALVRRFDMDADLTAVLKRNQRSIQSYQDAVNTYRNAQSKEQKKEMLALIKDIKSEFRSEISQNDPNVKKLKNLEKEHNKLTNWINFFEFSKEEETTRLQKIQTLKIDIENLKTTIKSIENNEIYKNAFEWRFEFPEVLDDKGNFIGFDAVMGNPPYIRQEEFSDLKPYLKDRFAIYHSIADLLTYFVELSYTILKRSGSFQFIISNKFTRANYGKVMRKFLSNNTKLTHFIDFGGVPVFDEATVDAAVLGFEKISIQNPNILFAKVKKEDFNKISDFQKLLDNIKVNFPQSALSENTWAFESPAVLCIKKKVEAKGTPLKNWNIEINFGIKTGYNEAFIISKEKKDELIAEDPKSAEVLKPILRGRDIQKYHTNFAHLWLIALLPSRNYDIEKFSAIKKYLLSFGKRLEQSGQKGSRKKTTNKWFETQDNISFWKNFEKPKIIWKRIGSILRFCYDDSNYFCLDSTCIATGEKVKFLCAVLNSKLCQHELFRKSPKTGTGDLIISVQALNPLMIPIPLKEQEKNVTDIFNKIQDAKSQNPSADTHDLEAMIDKLVYELYGLTKEEIQVVESSFSEQ